MIATNHAVAAIRRGAHPGPAIISVLGCVTHTNLLTLQSGWVFKHTLTGIALS